MLASQITISFLPPPRAAGDQQPPGALHSDAKRASPRVARAHGPRLRELRRCAGRLAERQSLELHSGHPAGEGSHRKGERTGQTPFTFVWQYRSVEPMMIGGGLVFCFFAYVNYYGPFKSLTVISGISISFLFFINYGISMGTSQRVMAGINQEANNYVPKQPF